MIETTESIENSIKGTLKFILKYLKTIGISFFPKKIIADNKNCISPTSFLLITSFFGAKGIKLIAFITLLSFNFDGLFGDKKLGSTINNSLYTFLCDYITIPTINEIIVFAFPLIFFSLSFAYLMVKIGADSKNILESKIHYAFGMLIFLLGISAIIFVYYWRIIEAHDLENTSSYWVEQTIWKNALPLFFTILLIIPIIIFFRYIHILYFSKNSTIVGLIKTIILSLFILIILFYLLTLKAINFSDEDYHSYNLLKPKLEFELVKISSESTEDCTLNIEYIVSTNFSKNIWIKEDDTKIIIVDSLSNTVCSCPRTLANDNLIELKGQTPTKFSSKLKCRVEKDKGDYSRIVLTYLDEQLKQSIMIRNINLHPPCSLKEVISKEIWKRVENENEELLWINGNNSILIKLNKGEFKNQKYIEYKIGKNKYNKKNVIAIEFLREGRDTLDTNATNRYSKTKLQITEGVIDIFYSITEIADIFSKKDTSMVIAQCEVLINENNFKPFVNKKTITLKDSNGSNYVFTNVPKDSVSNFAFFKSLILENSLKK